MWPRSPTTQHIIKKKKKKKKNPGAGRQWFSHFFDFWGSGRYIEKKQKQKQTKTK
jgi:hypothetical protein